MFRDKKLGGLAHLLSFFGLPILCHRLLRFWKPLPGGDAPVQRNVFGRQSGPGLPKPPFYDRKSQVPGCPPSKNQSPPTATGKGALRWFRTNHKPDDNRSEDAGILVVVVFTADNAGGKLISTLRQLSGNFSSMCGCRFALGALIPYRGRRLDAQSTQFMASRPATGIVMRRWDQAISPAEYRSAISGKTGTSLWFRSHERRIDDYDLPAPKVLPLTGNARRSARSRPVSSTYQQRIAAATKMPRRRSSIIGTAFVGQGRQGTVITGPTR